MKKQPVQLLLFVCALFFCKISQAQLFDACLSPQEIALGSQPIAPSAFNITGNAAMMTDTKKMLFGISVVNKYALSNLKQGGIGFTCSLTKSDFIGVTIQFDGTPNLKQQLLGLGYAKKINDKFSCGLSVLYLSTFEQTIGSRGSIIAKPGIYFKPTRNVTVEVSVYNPFAMKFTKLTQERIPTIIQGGLAYHLSAQLRLYASYQFGFNTNRNIMLGLRYEPHKGIIFFAGFQNNNSPFSFGMGYKFKNITLICAFQYHQVLGFSPAIGGEWEK